MGIRQAAMAEMAKRELARRDQAMTGTPEIIEETHDDVSFADRAIVKNFSQNPEKSARYLAKNNPQLETRVWDGRVLVKSKGDTKWNALDPDTGMFSTDIIGDIADVGYDVASGLAQVGGGTIAGLASGGVAGLGGAAAVGAGAEALRQGAGAALGIDNELGEGIQDVAISGALGAAVPGIGKAIMPGIKKATSAAVKKAPAFLSKIGNESKEQLAFLRDHVDDLGAMEKDGLNTFMDSARTEAADTMKNHVGTIGETIGSVSKSLDDIDITSAKNALKDRIDELKASYQALPNEKNESNLKAAIEMYNDNFGKKKFSGELVADEFGMAVDEIEDSVSGELALEMKQNIKADSGSFNIKDDAFKSRHSKATGAATKQTKNAALASEQNITKEMNKASGGQIGKLNKLYGDGIKAQGKIGKIIKDNDKFESQLTQALKQGKDSKRELLSYFDNRYGTDFISASNKLNMYNTFSKNAKGSLGIPLKDITKQTPLSSGMASVGAIAGWKTASAAGAAAGGAVGQALGKKLSSPKALRTYIEATLKGDKFAKNLDKQTKEWLKEELFRKISKGDALRESIKTTANMSKDRG